jgi:hypothetical protein
MALLLVLLALWLVGFAVNWGAFVWILLVAALVAQVANVLQVRAPVLSWLSVGRSRFAHRPAGRWLIA